MRGSMIAAVAAAALVAPALTAQAKPKEDDVVIPESALPPAGMCRVWLRDVPERQQPAPTDCATALRSRPRDALLLFGDLSQVAKQPADARRTNAREADLFDYFPARGFRANDVRSARFRAMGTLTPAQAAAAAAAAAQGTAPPGSAQPAQGVRSASGTQAAAKADPPKPIKPPDSPPQ